MGGVEKPGAGWTMEVVSSSTLLCRFLSRGDSGGDRDGVQVGDGVLTSPLEHRFTPAVPDAGDSGVALGLDGELRVEEWLGEPTHESWLDGLFPAGLPVGEAAREPGAGLPAGVWVGEHGFESPLAVRLAADPLVGIDGEAGVVARLVVPWLALVAEVCGAWVLMALGADALDGD